MDADTWYSQPDLQFTVRDGVNGSGVVPPQGRHRFRDSSKCVGVRLWSKLDVNVVVDQVNRSAG